MLSFPYLEGKDQAACLRDFVRERKYGGERRIGSMFVDSGAFSFQNKFPDYDLTPGCEFRTEVVDPYTSFQLSLSGIPDTLCANLDNIGNAEQTLQLQLHFEKYGLRPVPVVHCGAEMKDLAHYMERNYPIIGLGGFFRKGKKEIRDWCDQAFDLIRPEITKVKVHGFAMARHDLICRYPWWSVDSTTWLLPATIGRLYLPHRKNTGEWDYGQTFREVYMLEGSKWKAKPGKHYANISPEVRREVDYWLAELGLDAKELSTNPDLIVRANIIYWKNLEESRPEWPQH